ncbi:hypothetical protein HK096_008116 [Nowakowskiella sp. JEL0078]|nr:hypothetical protein HK096_008116 [Nowakowskiella sp. JEL0078]
MQTQKFYEELRPHFQRIPPENKPVVVMTCAVSGAGKTTLSKAICKNSPSFVRLSVDEYIWAKYGCYNRDYTPKQYASLQLEARIALKEELITLLRSNEKNVVVDFAFWSKKFRDEWRDIAEQEGARVVLVHLKANRDLLVRRIMERREKGIDANSAAELTPEIIDQYIAGFEVPQGEGEIVLLVN